MPEASSIDPPRSGRAPNQHEDVDQRSGQGDLGRRLTTCHQKVDEPKGLVAHASIRKCRQRVRRRSERFADVQERSSRPPLIGEMASASCDALGYEKVHNEG
jgi:hypothetical protein